MQGKHKECPSGKYCPARTSEPVQCPAGTYRDSPGAQVRNTHTGDKPQRNYLQSNTHWRWTAYIYLFLPVNFKRRNNIFHYFRIWHIVPNVPVESTVPYPAWLKLLRTVLRASTVQVRVQHLLLFLPENRRSTYWWSCCSVNNSLNISVNSTVAIMIDLIQYLNTHRR